MDDLTQTKHHKPDPPPPLSEGALNQVSTKAEGVILAALDRLPDGLQTGYAAAPLRNGETVSFYKFSQALVVGGKEEALVFLDTKGGRICLQEAALLPSVVPYTSLPQALESPAYQDTAHERVIERPLLFLAGTGARAPYHWPHDGLTRLLAARQGNFEFSILIPSHHPSSSFIKESLELLGFPETRIEYAHPHERIRAKEVWICEDLEASPTKHATLLQELRTRMLTAVGCDPKISLTPSEGTKLYISRQGSPTKRAVENGAEFEKVARDLGFHEQRMEKLPLAEQIKLAAGTTHLLTPHGAGLFHTLYMPGGTVVELFSVDETGRETNKPCWDRIIDVHRLEGRTIVWSALESTIVRKHDEEMDQFTIGADIPRVTALLERSDQGEPNKWNRIPLVETRP